MRIGIVAADGRQRAVGEAFVRLGWQVEWITSPGCFDFPVVFPMPVSTDGVHLFESGTPLADWLAPLQGKTVYGGRCTAAVKELAEANGVHIRDHFEREEEVILNVIPTVEGALQIAMEQTPFTLHGSRTLVCGFGRIGRLLARALAALGASVTVSARKERDFAWCRALGYQSVHTDALAAVLPEQDIVFSTVPAMIFDKAKLDQMVGESVLIDLASAPGSVDFAYAERSGKRAIQALALPVKVAPRTAGEIICNTIINMYQEEENTRVR